MGYGEQMMGNCVPSHHLPPTSSSPQVISFLKKAGKFAFLMA